MLNNIYYIGSAALMNAQVAINITGQNVANADTEGYSRQTVTFTSREPTMFNGWQIGTGADVQDISRNYNRYIESQYLTSNAERIFWGTQASTLSNVETLFSESGDYGLSTALDTLFTSATALEQDPGSEALRTEFLEYAETLADTLRNLNDSLTQELQTLESEIADSVEEANSLMKEIAALNAACAAAPDDNALLDERDLKIRALSELIDVRVIEQDNGMLTVHTMEGQTLVDGTESFRLAYEPAQSFANIDKDSTFDGEIYFDGEYSSELTIDMLTSGAADGSATAATFRVSLDGGETWVTDDDGSPMVFTAGSYDDRVEVEGVEIWFGQSGNSNLAATTDLSAEDSFNIVPKSGVYWYQTTSDKVNVTPLESSPDASDGRLTGGVIGGLLAVRDYSVATYQERMDALAEELIWQMNYQHSQGAGLTHYSYADADNSVDDATTPLAETDLAFADRITEGGFSLALYDSDSGDPLGVTEIDFSSIVPPGISTFDPAQHSLNDVATAITASCGGDVTATVSDGRLIIESVSGVEFEFAGDSTGLLAATGLNTLFTGSGLSDIAVSAEILADTNRLNCAQVDGTGMVEEGDSSNIELLSELASKDVTLNTAHTTTSQTITEHLHAVVAQVGLDTDSSARNYTLANTIAEDLSTQQESVAGVNMDEELTKLTRYQQAYQAAAQLIQTANEMFDIVMDLKN